MTRRIYIGRTGSLALPLFILAGICFATDNAQHYISARGMIVMGLAFPIGWIGWIGAGALGGLIFSSNSVELGVMRYIGGFIGAAVNIYLLSAVMLFLCRKRPADTTDVPEAELQKLLDQHRGKN